MIAIFLLAFTLSLFSFGTAPAAAGDVAGVSTHLFLTVLRDYDHDAAFSVTYTDALGTHTKPYHAGMEVTAWSPVTITCTNHHVYDWSIDADVQEATIVGVGGITYPGGTDAQQFAQYCAFIEENRCYDTGITIQPGDRLLTLSTCAYHTANGRFLVVARQID